MRLLDGGRLYTASCEVRDHVDCGLLLKYPDKGTEEAVRRADIFTHTIDLILDHHETSHGPRIRKRRERVTLTDILDDEQRDALINFSGKISKILLAISILAHFC